jgi:aspartate aminotransferase
MPGVSQRALGLQESAIRKLDQVVAKQRDARFYRLNIGQPDVPTPKAMLDAIRDWQPKVIAYGPASGMAACREAAAAYTSRWSPGLGPEHVAITAGGSEALLFAFTTVCDPGDEILVPEPYYTNYNGFATVAGATVRGIRTRIEDNFAIPADAELDRLVTERTKAIVLNTPGNPTGVVYSRAEMERVVGWAKRRNLFVIADEVYRRIWFDQEPASALQVPGAEDHVIMVDSMSKTWSACGIRIGWLVSRNGEVMEKVERLGQARLGPQPLAQESAMAAFSLPEGYYEEVRHIWRDRVHALYDALSGLGVVDVPRPSGAFYLMNRLPVDDADKFARFLVSDFRDAGESVVLAPGSGFYANPADGRDQARLAAVLEPQKLHRAVEILGKALEAYPGRV